MRGHLPPSSTIPDSTAADAPRSKSRRGSFSESFAAKFGRKKSASMLSTMHPPQLVGSMSRRSSMRSGSFLARETSTEENCAYVDNMIHAIQTQIKRELGFKEIVVATGDEVLENGGSNASSSAATVDSVGNGNGIPIPSTSATTTNSTPGVESPQSTYSDDVRQVVGDELWDSMKSSRRGYLYGLKPKSSESASSSYSGNGDPSHCSDCAKGTVYVSPYYKSKKRVLVIVPYREAGIWSRSICMQQTSASDNTGSMLAYLKKALAENYGVVIMNPAAQVCHPSAHVEQAWDQLIAPLDSDVFVIAFSRGCQYVKHLLNHDNGQGIVQDRVKALALVEPSHYVHESDTYFARRVLARRAVAWILSTEIDVGSKIPKGEARHGCVCISAGVVPMNVQGSSGAWALEIVMSSVFGSFAARCGETSGITVNDTKISSCGICHRKLGVLNRRIPCSWCEVKHCSKCCEDKFVPSFGSWRVCSLCQSLPCLIDPRRKNKSAKNHKSPTAASANEERLSVFIKPQGDEPVSLRDFEIIKLIGRGACGRVKLVRKNHGSDEGSFYAMKAIRKKLVIQRGLVEATNAERRILDRTNHTYVAALCYAFQSESKLYLLSKYCPGGNLLDQMRLARRFTEDRTRLYTAEVALAIRHLHESDIIYRDLKLENVLVDSDGHVALTDFGMSKENMDDAARTSTFVGTYQMMAPEVFSGKSYSRAVDWWALGVMVYEMIDGRTPFNAKTNKLIKERIVNVDLKFSPRFTDDAKDFVSKLLTKSEDDRLGCGENGFTHIKNHPWFGGLDWDKVALRQETFEGQAELMKSHAKEYKTSDIFDTYMNTIEVPVDTPASVKSSSSELFGDFAFNFMDESSVGDEPEFEEPGDTAEDGEDAGTEDGDDVSPAAAPSATDAEIETFLTSVDSQFDINLLRPDRATDFGLSVSSASLSSSGSGDEAVTVVETVADPALTTMGLFTKLAVESPTESSLVSPVKTGGSSDEASQP